MKTTQKHEKMLMITIKWKQKLNDYIAFMLKNMWQLHMHVDVSNFIRMVVLCMTLDFP